jgi:hypothetical protein
MILHLPACLSTTPLHYFPSVLLSSASYI